MAWAAIRDAIQTVIAGVSGVGQVHDRIRSINNDRDLQALLVSSGIINGWMHTEIGLDAIRLTNTEDQERHQWMIRGWYSFNDAGASEATFKALVHTIREAIRPATTLLALTDVEWVDAVTIVTNPDQHVIIPPGDGGVLCHFVEMRFAVQTRVTR